MSKCPTCGKERPKSNEQRNQFHRLCKIIGDHIGETPGKVKEAIKADYFGIDEFKIGDKWYRAVRPSEQAAMAEYSDLISFTYIWAADNLGLVLDMDMDVM